ncbi:MAG: hypothetical protein ACPGIJ_14295, partial [Mycobacterium sp.]
SRGRAQVALSGDRGCHRHEAAAQVQATPPADDPPADDPPADSQPTGTQPADTPNKSSGDP